MSLKRTRCPHSDCFDPAGSPGGYGGRCGQRAPAGPTEGGVRQRSAPHRRVGFRQQLVRDGLPQESSTLTQGWATEAHYRFKHKAAPYSCSHVFFKPFSAGLYSTLHNFIKGKYERCFWTVQVWKCFLEVFFHVAATVNKRAAHDVGFLPCYLENMF